MRQLIVILLFACIIINLRNKVNLLSYSKEELSQEMQELLQYSLETSNALEDSEKNFKEAIRMLREVTDELIKKDN